GCGAHLESLRRLQSGEFRVEQAIPLVEATASHVTPLERLLSHFPSIVVSGIEEDRVHHGNPIRTELDAGNARIFNRRGQFIGVAAVERGWARPQVVLTSKDWIEHGDGG